MAGGFEDDFFVKVDENPFEDASVRGVLSNSNNATNDLSMYDPFSSGDSQQPAVIKVNSEPPTYTKTAQQSHLGEGSSSDAKVDQLEAELIRTKETLKKTEDELRRRTEELDRSTTDVRPKNFPPVQMFGIQPCFYMDIDVEIRPEFKKIVRDFYRLWIANMCLLVCNVIGELSLLVGYGDIKGFTVAILFLVLFTPLSFLCWYRPVYKALRDDSSIQFMHFFLVFFFQFIITAYMAIGAGSGSCGIWTAIVCFNEGHFKGTFIGILVLLIALSFAGTAALMLFLLSKMVRIYRGTEASVKKATEQIADAFLKSNHVREAVIKLPRY